MAQTLMEALSTGLQESQVKTKPQAPTATEATQSLLATKATGRAITPGTGPKSSAQAEKMTLEQGAQEQKKEGLRQQLAQTGLSQQAEAQQQRFDVEEKQGLDRVREMEADFQRRSDGILSDFERGKRRLGDEKDALALEVMGQQARLANAKYLDALEQQGKELGLNNKLKFDEETARTVLKNDLDFLKDDLAHRRLMNANDRDFTRELANMDINFAMDMARQGIREAGEQQKWQGINGMMSGGAQAYSAYETGESRTRGLERDIEYSGNENDESAAIRAYEDETGNTFEG